MKNKITIFVLMTVILTSGVNAERIFNEDFESGNLIEWNLSSISLAQNWTSNQTDPFSGNWHAQSNPRISLISASVLEKEINTSGYQNISLSYYRKLVGIDSSDEWRVKWFDGTNWHTLEQTGSNSANDQNYTLMSFNLPQSAENNSNLKIRFECSAQALSEFCRLDNIALDGNPITEIYKGTIEYMQNYNYNIMINKSSKLIKFKGINLSNQNTEFEIPFDSNNRFTKKINYIWFDGSFDNNNLYLNQYVGLGNSHIVNASSQISGIYNGVVQFNSLPLIGINNSVNFMFSFDSNNNLSSAYPIIYPNLTTNSILDDSINRGSHVYGSMLFEVGLIQNGNQNFIEVSEWVKEDLNNNGLNPRWTIPILPT